MVDIVWLNVSFCFGLDIMTKYKFYVDTVRDKLCIPHLRLEVVRKKYDHMYYEW